MRRLDVAIGKYCEETGLWIFELIKGEELDMKELQVLHIFFCKFQHVLVSLDHLE